jgi:hypothetical protein
MEAFAIEHCDNAHCYIPNPRLTLCYRLAADGGWKGNFPIGDFASHRSPIKWAAQLLYRQSTEIRQEQHQGRDRL